MRLNCQVEGDGYEVLYKSSDEGLEVLESDTAAVFGDYFNYDADRLQSFDIEVCTYDIMKMETAGDSCSEELISVSASISRHSDRLLPFAQSFSDGKITAADDKAEAIFLTDPIPYWTTYYTSLYVSITY